MLTPDLYEITSDAVDSLSQLWADDDDEDDEESLWSEDDSEDE